MFKRTKFAIKDGQFFFCGQPYELTSSVSRGIPAFPVDLILQHELVKLKILLIRGMCPLRSADFDRLLMPVIRSLVQHVHLQTATETSNYSEVMGLLSHCLDVAYRALVIARSEEWKDSLAAHWQIAAVLAGLLKDISVPYENLEVQGINNVKSSDAFEPLSPWLKAKKENQYYVCWKAKRGKTHKELTLSVQIAQAIVSVELQELLEPVWKDFCVAIDVQGARSRNSLQKILNQANRSSVACSLAASCDMKLSRGSLPPLWFNYLSLIWILVQSKKLTVNQPDSAVFITKNLGVLLDLYAISNLSKHSPFPAQYAQPLGKSSEIRQADRKSTRLNSSH